MAGAMQLVCSECGATPAGDPLFCDACGGLLGFELDVARFDAAALRHTFAQRRLSDDPIDRSGVWRFRELLPPIATDAIVTLRENELPSYDARLGATYADATCVSYLHLGMNPTASFKDAGMTVAISHAKATARARRGLREYGEHGGRDGRLRRTRGHRGARIRARRRH